MSILIGLTGNTGSGKSLAASYFKELGAFIIDADLICRQLVVPYKPAWKEIVGQFGKKYLNFDKTLNRSKLAIEIFQNDIKRAALESILHPRVIAEEKNIYFDCQKLDPQAIVIIDSALLIESKNYKNVDKVIIIKSNEELQIKRVMNRDNKSRAAVKKRIQSQMSLEKKMIYADYIIDNTNNRDLLKIQVHKLYTTLKSFL
ncbi:MAG: dephospho-CoA kinase [Nitrospina sp.]|nr:dephospho-CoA kinase [Nitrospina sp.]